LAVAEGGKWAKEASKTGAMLAIQAMAKLFVALTKNAKNRQCEPSDDDAAEEKLPVEQNEKLIRETEAVDEAVMIGDDDCSVDATALLSLLLHQPRSHLSSSSSSSPQQHCPSCRRLLFSR
jgi:hypothetical protein